MSPDAETTKVDEEKVETITVPFRVFAAVAQGDQDQARSLLAGITEEDVLRLAGYVGRLRVLVLEEVADRAVEALLGMPER